MPTTRTSDPGTDTLPRRDPGKKSSQGFLRRLNGSMSDPVLRILVVTTLISRVGRGVFLTVTVLYMTFVIGLSAGEAATVLGISSAVGVGTSYLGGRLADRLSARRLLFALMAFEGLALLCYPLAGDFISILIIASVVSAMGSASNATRMAIVARAFEGPARVDTRAILRTVTNLSIALGAAIAGVALLADSAAAYRIVMIGAGAVQLVGIIPVWNLPPRVDAPAPVLAAGVSDTDGRAHDGPPQRGRSPFRDRRYLFLTALSAVFGMQFGLAEVGVPLWVAHHTNAPTAVVSALLILNTVVVILFQIPLSRGTDDVQKSGKVVALAGVLMAGACIVYGLSAGVSVGTAIVLLLVAATAHAFAEVWSQAGTWGLSFEFANPLNPGAYQGMFAMGAGLGSMCAPFVVAGTALRFGLAGWAALAVMLLAAALGISAMARREARRAAEERPVDASTITALQG
ncbi:MFS transporter [Paeniglutamicibacter sp. NPDC012692]|uniref:MFS transporter n=1 Tax=Paeniglutamicibacter sp. NPDC012692 TaxID=3364388 RepID=UPI00367DF326